MSILNVWHSRDRVIVAADSRWNRPAADGSGNGERITGAAEKLRTYPVAGVVYASTGNARLSAGIGAALGTFPRLACVDDFALVFPSVFAQAWERFKAGAVASPGVLLTGSLHCLAGYSTRRSGMRAVLFESPEADAPLVQSELIDEQIAAPWHDGRVRTPTMSSVGAMAAVCADQIRQAESAVGALASVGWPCVVAELRRREIRVRRIGA